MSNTVIRVASCLSVLALIAAGLCADLSVSAGSSTQNSNSSGTVPQEATPTNKAEMVAAAPAPQEIDLSGTYTGTFSCEDAGVSGEQTLTITGNTFSLSDGKSGRITAATTRGYTGVTMQFGELVLASKDNPTGTRPVIVSMRARKSGDRLTLSTVPNARQVCAFTPKR
jgi:hypothetical protein